MSDIQTIEVNNTVYDIKDAKARTDIDTLNAAFGGTGALFNTLFDLLYPVGSYYETSDTSFNPNAAWRGTWVLETAGQVHVSAGTGYSVSGALTNHTDGGSKNASVVSHSHSIPERSTFPSGSCTTYGMNANETHYHTLDGTSDSVAKGSSYDRPRNAGVTGMVDYYTSAVNLQHAHVVPDHVHVMPAGYTVSNGVSGTNKNMPPYIVVKRWHRTA